MLSSLYVVVRCRRHVVSTQHAGGSVPPRPVFLQTTRNVSVDIGDRAVLNCRVDNIGSRVVSLDDKDLNPEYISN